VRNIKLILQYDGAGFSGYELQPGKKSIRGEIEKSLFKLFNKKIRITAASRTDAGVHALNNVINIKINHPIPAAKLVLALNSLLPEDIRVVKANEVSKNFNARFDVKSKTYEYLIYNGKNLNPIFRRFVWQVKPKLDLKAMRKAAKILVGKHDFSSFCASRGDDRNFVRTIHSFVIRHSSFMIWGGSKLKVISLRVTANGYLYKMVRNMVGTLAEVGLGRILPGEIEAILMANDRKLAGRTAPAAGLCLIKVNY
jgi:tRNA pseudouridine38-40 synthase